MANPQPDRYIRISTELFEALCRMRMPGESRQMLDVIIRKTWGFHKKSDSISTSQFMQLTGLSRSCVHSARSNLKKMNIISITEKEYTSPRTYSIQKDYEKWKPLKRVGYTRKVTHSIPEISHRVYQKSVPTIDTIIDNTIDKTTAPTERPVNNLLKTKIEEVHKSGFNISMLINTFYKRSKLREKLPDDVLINVCDEYLLRKDTVKSGFPYFLKVLNMKSARHFSQGHEKESIKRHKNRGGGVSSLQSILKSLQEGV